MLQAGEASMRCFERNPQLNGVSPRLELKTKQDASTKMPNDVLRLPDQDQAESAVVSRLLSKESQRGHRHAIDEFINRYCT